MAKIAVEQSLSNVKDTLRNNQFEVVDFNGDQEASISDVSCYVISGEDKDVLGIADTQGDIPVINANGMTQEEVLDQVQQRVQIVNATNE